MIKSGGDKIKLTWTDKATGYPNFDGYEVCGSEGSALDPKTVYTKIFGCDASGVVYGFEEITAARGFGNYYYIVSKDDGSTNDLDPGVP
ncbi:hypothetical protein JW948_01975 [bacterium]|nr:hypothetical protein [bacterium]